MSDTFRCNLCKLCRINHPVLGYGNENADIMLIGEAPGRDEVKYNKPFVGKAGKLLDECLEEAGLDRKDLYITNTILGRPPDNKIAHAWAKEALEVCPYTYLFDTIKKVKPMVIVLLGNTPLQQFHGFTGITKVRGEIRYWNGIPTIPVLHPAYFLRGKIAQSYQLVSDLRLAKKLVAAGGEPQYVLLDTFEKCMSILTNIKENVRNFAIDTETTGLNVYKDKVFGIPLAYEEFVGYYMPIRKKDIIGNDLIWTFEQEKQEKILNTLKDILLDETKIKALHNADYDLLMLENDLGIEIKGEIVDTMIMNHLVDENRPKTLHYLSQRYEDIAGYDYEVEKIKNLLDSKKNIDLLEVPLKHMTKYGAGDAIVTYREAVRTVDILRNIEI